MPVQVGPLMMAPVGPLTMALAGPAILVPVVLHTTDPVVLHMTDPVGPLTMALAVLRTTDLEVPATTGLVALHMMALAARAMTDPAAVKVAPRYASSRSASKFDCIAPLRADEQPCVGLNLGIAWNLQNQGGARSETGPNVCFHRKRPLRDYQATVCFRPIAVVQFSWRDRSAIMA